MSPVTFLYSYGGKRHMTCYNSPRTAVLGAYHEGAVPQVLCYSQYPFQYFCLNSIKAKSRPAHIHFIDDYGIGVPIFIIYFNLLYCNIGYQFHSTFFTIAKTPIIKYTCGQICTFCMYLLRSINARSPILQFHSLSKPTI